MANERTSRPAETCQVEPVSSSGKPKVATRGKTRPGYPTEALLVVTLSVLLIDCVETVVIPGIPVRQKDLRTTETLASWIASAFLIVGAALTKPFVKLGDVYGKKKMFLVVIITL